MKKEGMNITRKIVVELYYLILCITTVFDFKIITGEFFTK